MTWATPPPADVTEISIFGPGVGECIVVHLGDSQWIVVDSCVDATTGNPVALDYFTELGVDVAAAVRRLIVTHWHDDHIRGASSILAAAPNAALVCSAALNRNEFLQALKASQAPYLEPSGLDEFADSLRVLKRRGRGRKASKGPSWAIENQCLLRDAGAAVYSLSPSSGTFTLALTEIHSLLPAPGAPKRRAVSQGPNQLSIVLWVESGANTLLLGGDLESGRDRRVGWHAIVASPQRPPGAADVFKAAHHGSPNADHEGIWEQLLAPDPRTIVAPYYAGAVPRPSLDDLRRLKSRSAAVYCTAQRRARKSSRRTEVDKMVRLATKDLREVQREIGQVRLRRARTGVGNWEVMLRRGSFEVAA